MDSERLRFKGHLWYVFEVGLLVYCLYDLGACQYKLGVGQARGLSTFWSGAGRVATLVLLVYLGLLVFTWYRRRVLAHRLSRVRLLVSTQVLAWLFVLYDASEFHAVRVHFAIGLGVGMYALVQMARAFAAERLWAKGVRRADLILFGVCAVLIGLEIGLRTLATFSDAAILSHPDDSVIETVRRNAPAPGQFRYGFPFNSASHYDAEFGPKDADRRRVLSIGDSFSTGVVPHHHHFTTVAERGLPGVEVSNMGVPGLGPFEYLHLLRTEGDALKPDVVIVNVAVGSDFVESWLRQRERLGQKRTVLESWYTRSSVYLCLMTSRFWSFATEAHRVPADQGEVLGWEKDSKIAQHADELERAFPWILDPQRERPAMSDESFFEFQTRRAAEVATRDRKTYEPAFFQAMERIRGDLDGKPWAVVLIPDAFQVDDGVWSRIQTGLPGASLARFHAQEVVKAWAADKKIPCLDLLPVLRAVEPLDDGERHVFHRNDPHFNARGNAIAGEALAEFLAKQFPFLARGG